MENKIKIFYISRTSNFTGAENIVFDIVRNLDSNVFNPCIVLPDRNGYFYKKLIDNNLNVKIIKMPFIRISYNPFILFWFLISLIVLNVRFYFFLKRNKADIVSCNTIHEASFVAIPSKLLKIKLVICFKNILDKKWKKKFRAKFCELFADKIISVSYKANEDFTNYVSRNSSKKNISVVINDCISPDDYLKDFKRNEVIKNYFNKSLSDFIIINIGSITMLKGQMLLLESLMEKKLKNINNIKVLLIGDIYHKNDNYYKNEIINFINKNNLNNKVFLTNYQKDVRNFLYECSLFVHCPIIDDAFPRVILEAFSFSKIVLATKVGGIPEIIKDGYNGFLCEINSIDLSNKIFYIYNNLKNLQHIKQNAFKTVSEHLNLRMQIIKTEKIYKEMLGLY